MKSTILPIALLTLVFQAPAQTTDYRTSLDSAHAQLRTLEIELHDYRKPKPELPPDQESERRRVLGHLLTDDPVWTLGRQLQGDIDVLVSIPGRTAEDSILLENLQELLAITSRFEARATTRAEAEAWATALSQFIVRRDVPQARIWEPPIPSHFARISVQITPAGADDEMRLRAHLPKDDPTVTVSEVRNTGVFQIGVTASEPKLAARRASEFASAVDTALRSEAHPKSLMIVEKAEPSLQPVTSLLPSQDAQSMLTHPVKPEIAAKLARFQKQHFDALIAEGFNREEALKIVTSAPIQGIPTSK